MTNFLNILNKNELLITEETIENIIYNKIEGEFWTSKQKQGNNIHEISYRACFKPQLPQFFINNFSLKNDIVYDPFLGRGTTIIEAALLGRKVIGNDINPLSKILTEPRLNPPTYQEIENRLNSINFDYKMKAEIDLSMFYHPNTEAEIISLKNYLLNKEKLDYIDKWIRMVTTNRLTGHSKGFFSVYTLPPNQAVSQQRQIEINKKRNQIPEYKNIKPLILKKSKQLLKSLSNIDIYNLKKIYKDSIFINNDARYSNLSNNSINLIITSPPFLNLVQYSKDNWIRCWFNNINIKNIENRIFITSSLIKWKKFIFEVFLDLFRILKPNGILVFEVGEIKKNNNIIFLEQELIPIANKVGFKILGVLINSQNFSKTSNIWGINNNNKGTNSNRILILSK